MLLAKSTKEAMLDMTDMVYSFWALIFYTTHERGLPMEGELVLLPPIRQDGRKSSQLYAVPNKRTKPYSLIY